MLAPFAVLYARRDLCLYGGRVLSFLSLPDLLRSKETESTADWEDVAVLEEFLDTRALAHVDSSAPTLHEALGPIRCRIGFEEALQKGFLADSLLVEQALKNSKLSMSQAFLLPIALSVTDLPPTQPAMEPVILNRLRTVEPASSLHLTLVEAVRRQYRLVARTADQADKKSILRVEGV